jgi:hypothetical protein
MEIFSYIMTVATLKTGVEVLLAIRNIAGTGRVQYGRSGEFGNIEMWIIPKSKKSKEELVTQLISVPFIQQVSVVKLSNPITKNELLEVHELFSSLGWDTSDIQDEELSLFLNAKLQGKYTYIIDFEHGKGRTTEKVSIIRAEEHPHFSPEWLANTDYEEEILERELTIDDLEIRSFVVETVVEEVATPPPPPPPPPPPTAGDQTR